MEEWRLIDTAQIRAVFGGMKRGVRLRNIKMLGLISLDRVFHVILNMFRYGRKLFSVFEELHINGFLKSKVTYLILNIYVNGYIYKYHI